jgi:hypothetical protein
MKPLSLALIALILLAPAASAGDLAVADSTLSTMGLSGMQRLSDEAGAQIRGKGPFEDRWMSMFGGSPAWPFGTPPTQNDPSPDFPGNTPPPSNGGGSGMPTGPRAPGQPGSHFNFNTIFSGQFPSAPPFGG